MRNSILLRCCLHLARPCTKHTYALGATRGRIATSWPCRRYRSLITARQTMPEFHRAQRMQGSQFIPQHLTCFVESRTCGRAGDNVLALCRAACKGRVVRACCFEMGLTGSDWIQKQCCKGLILADRR